MSKLKIKIGLSWQDSKGRVWEVVENLHFGVYRVRTTDLARVGEMRADGIRHAVETANAMGRSVAK